MKSGRGDLLVQAAPQRGLVGALESRFTTAQTVEEPTWRRWSRPPCCLTVFNPSDSSSRGLEVPSQLLSSRLVIPVIWLVFLCFVT